MSLRALALVLLLAGCKLPAPSPVIQVARPIVEVGQPAKSVIVVPGKPVNPVTEAIKPLVALPPAPKLSPAGLALIYNYETGGQRQYERRPYPELPDLRLSGVTEGIGYDNHQYSKAVIIQDWAQVLKSPAPQRLAETQPFYGRSAVAYLQKVKDILIPWSAATHVFLNNDVAREFAAARRAYPGFDELTANCQAALIANGFARGYGFTGPNRTELRTIRGLTLKKDYKQIAAQLRAQEHVWRGTTIYNGLRARVYAEATLSETP